MTREAAHPKRVGRYRILSELGSGGMGIVYLAEARTGDRVALKVIRPDLARSEEFRERFAREAKAASAITGACTARVVDVDTDGRTPFIATEFIDGLTLEGFVSHHGPLEGDQLRMFALALAEALASIHRGGLIHRDLKPTNVLLSETGPRVIDFGIAKAVEETSFTGTGVSLGTPAWMAPEQARGQRATAAADVFGWGCLVSYAASGNPPFGYGSPDAMLYRVVHEEPDVPSLPGDLDHLVSRSLAKDPSQRPSTADVVGTLLSDQTVTNVDRTVSNRVADTVAETWHVPDSFGGSPVKHRRRPLIVAAALSLLVLLAVAAYVVAGALDREPALRPAAAEAEPTEAREEDPTPSPPPVARSVDLDSLLRPGTEQEKVAYLQMDGKGPQEIAQVSAEHKGDVFAQRYLDIYSWNGTKWRRVFDATRYRPPAADDTVLPFGDPGGLGGRSVDFLRGIDFHGDDSHELAIGISTYGASSGPMEIFVLSKVGNRVRTEFTEVTERGGKLSKDGKTLVLATGEYLPSDAMCCPSFMKRTVIGAAGGELRYLDTDSKPTEHYVPPLEEASLSITSLGPLEIGMTQSEAEDASGKELSVGFDSGSCAYATPVNGPRGVSVMFLDGRLARIDIHEGNITTLSGIGIGSSEAEVYSTYAGQISREAHPYEGDFGWNYLIYTPEDSADQAFSMIFETDGQKVTSFRGGEREAVGYIEGCV